MGKERITFSPTHHTLFPTLTLTLTFHHPEQSLLHKLHWLDHVIRVGVFSELVCARYKHYFLPHITHLTAKPSRMIGVQVGVWWFSVNLCK